MSDIFCYNRHEPCAVTLIAVSDIFPASYSAKTDLFAFKTHSAPMIIAIVTRELKPYAIWAFPHVNNYSSQKPTWHKIVIKHWVKDDQTKQINSLTRSHWEQSLTVVTRQRQHFLDNAAWQQGPPASSRRWNKERGGDKLSLLRTCSCCLLFPFLTLIYPG